jgi:hypothetical protein
METIFYWKYNIRIIKRLNIYERNQQIVETL